MVIFCPCVYKFRINADITLTAAGPALDAAIRRCRASRHLRKIIAPDDTVCNSPIAAVHTTGVLTCRVVSDSAINNVAVTVMRGAAGKGLRVVIDKAVADSAITVSQTTAVLARVTFNDTLGDSSAAATAGNPTAGRY